MVLLFSCIINNTLQSMFAHSAFTAFQMIFLNNLFQNKFLEEDLAG